MISLIIPYMAIASRMSGGGLGASKVWSRLPELLLSLPLGYCAYATTDKWYLGVIGFIVSFFAMELGHGTAYKMTGYDDFGKGRMQTLDKVLQPFYVNLGGNLKSPLYSWLFMGIKGLLIGLAAFPFGLLLAILWPLSYWLGQVVEELNEPVAGYLSGMFAGLLIVLSLTYFGVV